MSYTLKELHAMYSIFKEPIPLDVLMNTTFESKVLLRRYVTESYFNTHIWKVSNPFLVKVSNSKLCMCSTESLLAVPNSSMHPTKIPNLFTSSALLIEYPPLIEVLRVNTKLHR